MNNTRIHNRVNIVHRHLLLVLCLWWIAGPANKALASDPCPPARAQLATGHVEQNSNRPKIGLALGGGGTRGAAHVGVLRVLIEKGIPIDYIAGTSMGAVVGGLYSAGVSVDRIESMIESRSLMNAFMTVPLKIRLLEIPLLFLPRIVGRRSYDGLYDGLKFQKYLDAAVPECRKNIEDLSIPFRAVALDLVAGKIDVLTSGKLGLSLQATSAVPGLRQPVKIGNKLYIDGGVMNNLPVDVVRNMGADIVIGVSVDERIHSLSDDSFKLIGSVTRRLIALELARADMTAQAQADIVIHPNVDGIGLLSGKLDDARRAINAGDEAAREAISVIQSRFLSQGRVDYAN